MELGHFNIYSTVLQAHLARTQGQWLGKRAVQGYAVELYAVQDFFAEVWLLGDQQGPVIEVNGFKSTRYLEPYLQDIRLE